jgi:ribosomal protein L11 methyltransferase
MGRTWIALTITCAADVQELLIPFLWESGATGFVEGENDITAYIPQYLWHDNVSVLFSQYRERLQDEGKIITDIQISTIQEQNWNEEWEKTIVPIQATDRIIIRPSWAPMVPQTGKIVLTINPKMSFGTGYHETTRMMLIMLEKVVQENDRVLDIGTGTGILAIAAVRLGASLAIGVDNDEWSFDNAQENVALNDVASHVTIRSGSIGSVPETDFNIVMTNIHYSVIVEMMEELLDHTADRGHILISGVMESDEKNLQQILGAGGCTIDGVLHEAEWIGISAVKGNR